MVRTRNTDTECTMNLKTESEIFFEQFTGSLSTHCLPIPCEKGQTPDYELSLSGHRVIAEIKQLDENVDDKINWAEARSRGVGSAFGGTEERLGRKFKKANKQLKSRCRGSIPGMTIVFDNGTFSGVDGTDIMEALYGKETVTFTRFSDGTVEPSDLHASREGFLGTTKNTTISAVGWLQCLGERSTLRVYHNRFAANPIDPNWFRNERITHRALSNDTYSWTYA